MGLGGGRHLQGRAGLELWEPALRGWRPLSEPDNERKEVTRREFGQKPLVFSRFPQGSRCPPRPPPPPPTPLLLTNGCTLIIHPP